jgi:HK97 family phage portal protein
MSILSRVAAKSEDIDHFFNSHQPFFGGMSKAGTVVSQKTALRLSTLLACIRVRSESFGCLPCSVFRKRANGKGQDEATEHPLYELVHNTPNEKMTALTWRETMNMNLDPDGNCYALRELNNRGQVTRLTPIPYYDAEPVYDQIEDKVWYWVTDRGKSYRLPPDQVFHVKGLSWDGVKGMSVIQMAYETFGRGLAIDEFTSRFFGQGMNFGLALETDQPMKDQEMIDNLRKQFEERGGGLQNAHRPIILHSGLKVNRIPLSFVDAQIIEMLNLTDMQICGLMRVPPHMVAHLENATFSNIEHQGIEYTVYSMLPLITRFEQEMNVKLFSRQEREQGYYVKFNINALLRGDAKAQAEALATQRQNGVINADEWRVLNEMNPIGGPAGETYLVQGAMISTETAAAQMPKQTGGTGSTPPQGGKGV